MDSKSATNPNRIIIYVRVSKKEQEEKHSLANQMKYAIEYCTKNGLILPNEKIPEKNIYIEVHSAAEVRNTTNSNDLIGEVDYTHRPKLRKIVQLAKDNKFDHFIVYNLDRFSRSTIESSKLITIFTLNNIKIHFSAPGELQIFDDNPFSNFMTFMKASLSEYEAENISVRVKSITREVALNGYWPGGVAPYGYKTIGNNKIKRKLAIFSEYRANKVRQVFHFAIHNGYGYKKIARLMKEKYPNENWTKSKVEPILNNETYTGRIVYDRRGGRRRSGKHQSSEVVRSEINPELSLVSQEFWSHISRLRQIKQKDPKYYCTPFLLRGKLKCGICNEYLKAKNHGEGKRKVYRCPSEKNSISELVIEKNSIEELFFSRINNIFKIEEINSLWLKYQTLISNKQKSLIASKEDVQKNIEEVIYLRKNISESLKSVIDKDFKSLMITQDLKLSHEELFWKAQYDELESEKIVPYSNIHEFKNAIANILNEFPHQTDSEKRMLIDILIDEIIVNKVENEIKLDIIVNPSRILTL